MSKLFPSVLYASVLLSVISGPNQSSIAAPLNSNQQKGELSTADIVSAFGRQGFRINSAEAAGIRPNVQLAIEEARRYGIGNSKIGFAAVEIAQDLSVGTDSAVIRRIVAAIGGLSGKPLSWARPIYKLPTPPPSRPVIPWEAYFDSTVNLPNQVGFMNLMRQSQFFPVKISWEDIGRHQGSVWGDRISDVGIWVRKTESDASSAHLALSVRRDSNFRDKVLMVPAEKIKVHIKQGGSTVEKTLPQRLKELGLSSPNRDRNVIVSNQFAIVPVPARDMRGAWPENAPPRAAFNFSIFTYGSTNFVITDVIEGSSEAVVGPGSHQMLYANVNGQKAPFTASRAEDRQDLLRLERELKSQGMDVDVQRYYLIQIPLRRDTGSIVLSNMGTPPMGRPVPVVAAPYPLAQNDFPLGLDMAGAVQPSVSGASDSKVARKERTAARNRAEAGLERVAIGHGEAEGRYFTGSGYQGARADEPIRITVVYFVTPKGEVTQADMRNFTRTFSQWDGQAIWGGSFVTKE